MAILTAGGHGPVSGRLGNVLYYGDKGQNRARPLPRVPKRRKPGPEQAAKRTRVEGIPEWLKTERRLVHIGFGRYAPPKTGHNEAMGSGFLDLGHGDVGSGEVSDSIDVGQAIADTQ